MNTVIVKTQEELDSLGKEVEGNLEIRIKGKASAPALTSVGGDLSVYGGAKLDALTSVGGNLYVSGEAKLDALTFVGGNLSVRGEAKLDAPALTSVGGNLYVSGEAKLPKALKPDRGVFPMSAKHAPGAEEWDEEPTAADVFAAERKAAADLRDAFPPPEPQRPQILEAWTCMRCGYPHSITTRDKARGVIDQDRCHCGENFYARKQD